VILLEFAEKLEAMYFTEVIPQMLPEIDFLKLLNLGLLVRSQKKTEMYESLRTSLRKIQWVRFVGIRAIAIEEDIGEQVAPNQLLMDPLGQIDHSLCITDLLIHTKSALDSMAIFLTDFLKLDAKKTKRDLKLPEFREAVKKADLQLGGTVDSLGSWLDEIQQIRDEWIHRESIRSFIISGPCEVGLLPIPRKPSLVGKLPPKDLKLTSKNFWSTRDFVNYHYSNLLALFTAIIDRCIWIELNSIKGDLPRLGPKEANMAQAIFFPTRSTQTTIIKNMKVSSIDLSSYYARLSAIFSKRQS
jgi:hypothetical protein